jgi:peptide/nickel transport system substrate-binding protein
MSRKIMTVLGLVLAISMILAACAPTKTPTQVATEPPATVPPEVVPTAAPTEPPTTRHGGWLDQVVVVEEPSQESAVTRLLANDIQVFAYGMSNSALYATVKDSADLGYNLNAGSMNELTFNPSPFTDATRLNPFAVRKIRECVNYLVDRNYIAQEIMGGLAVPKWVSMNSAFADYARYADLIAPLEIKYAYNLETAQTCIAAEMTTLGATLVDGKWNFGGAPVTVIFLIRTEDERRQIGDYVSTQFEQIGFTVDRQYKTSAEAAPIWADSPPADGLWNVYTAGWGATVISRDDSSDFGYFYTALGSGDTLWQAYVNDPAFFTVSEKLWNVAFSTMEERRALYAEALPLAMEDSSHLWLVDRKAFTPYRSNVQVVGDLAAGVAGSGAWPVTLRYVGQEGGSMTMAMPSILTKPWNALDGSNWLYDMSLERAVANQGFFPDPYTGLSWPRRVESATITATEGLPISKTLDWVTLEFVPEVVVPTDALVDWDATTQTFITAGTKFPEGLTSQIKATVTYPADLFTSVKWHDGSPFSFADMMMYFIMQFDRANPASAIYDEAQVARFNAFISTFKGLKILSENPLKFEWYTDAYSMDAELCATSLWPWYLQGEASWHALTLGIMAETAGELAFSSSKAKGLGVDHMSYIGGPSLAILKTHLDEALASSYIPYAPTMLQYISADEAAARWANLRDWYAVQGHFWVGTGPYFLDKAFPVEGTITLRNFPGYPDLADRWSNFGVPKIADVLVEGPASLAIGAEGTFDVTVTFQGEPYPAAEMTSVSYILFDANLAVVGTGAATLVEDGKYTVTLPAAQTSLLVAGSNKLTVVAVPLLVSLPTFSSFEFVSTAP